jgi:class 3 adenylate cyclase
VTRKTSGVDVPETRYAKSGEVNIAYQLVGEGPPDLVYIPGVIDHVELMWEIPVQARFLGRLASLGRLLRFDKRGTGMSDRVASVATLEDRMDDIRAVMDAADFDQAAIMGVIDGGALAALFAATYPERTSALILYHATPRFVRNPELQWLRTRADYEHETEELVRHWGDLEWIAKNYLGPDLPSATDEELEELGRTFRLSVSPGAIAAFLRMNLDLDVSEVLPLIRVPTLAMSRTDAGRTRTTRYMAARIPGARLVEQPGRDALPGFGDTDAVIAEVEAFLADVAEAQPSQVTPDRVLATVLFTDLIGSTARAVALGPDWRKLLAEHNAVVRRELARFRGRAIDTAGDGFFASGFDGPARAINCACAIRDGVTALGLGVRVGVHTGECDLIDDKLSGLAVHIGARVASQASEGEVLVSGTVKDLVAGSGINFEPRGVRELKGLGEWPLYAVTNSNEHALTPHVDR